MPEAWSGVKVRCWTIGARWAKARASAATRRNTSRMRVRVMLNSIRPSSRPWMWRVIFGLVRTAAAEVARIDGVDPSRGVARDADDEEFERLRALVFDGVHFAQLDR